MRRSAFAAKGLRGSGFPPVKPTVSYVSYGAFRLTNYNPLYRYTLVPNAGTSTTPDSSGNFTLSSTTVACTITPSFGPDGPATTVERKPASYTPDTRYCVVVGQYCSAYGQYCHCGTDAPCDGQSWGQCGCPGSMCWYGSYCAQYSNQYNCGGSAPALINEPGYTWNGSNEWYKIV